MKKKALNAYNASLFLKAIYDCLRKSSILYHSWIMYGTIRINGSWETTTSQTFANSHFTKKNFYYSLQNYFTKVLVKLLKYAVAFNELCITYTNYSLLFEFRFLNEKSW